MRSKTLGWREVSSWRRSLRMRRTIANEPAGSRPGRGTIEGKGAAALLPRPFSLRGFCVQTVFAGLAFKPSSHADAMFAFGVAGERVFRRLRAGNDFADGRLA